MQRERRRLNIFNNYLPVIAEFAMRLSENEELPNVAPLLQAVNTEPKEEKPILEEVRAIVEESSE